MGQIADMKAKGEEIYQAPAYSSFGGGGGSGWDTRALFGFGGGGLGGYSGFGGRSTFGAKGRSKYFASGTVPPAPVPPFRQNFMNRWGQRLKEPQPAPPPLAEDTGDMAAWAAQYGFPDPSI
jgi:hypothetical protein